MYIQMKNLKNYDCVSREKITVLVDEAYHYFYPKTFIKYALNERHVYVTRTFSKLFSMAGCRLGYVVGHPEDVKYVQKLCTPHNTNAFAMSSGSPTLPEESLRSAVDHSFRKCRNHICSCNTRRYCILHGYYHSQVLLPETLSIHLQQISMQDIHIRMVAHKYSP